MRRHMLTYHVGVPLAVLAVALLVGAPSGTALRVAIAAGCISMVVMMAAGGHRHRHRPPSIGDGTRSGFRG